MTPETRELLLAGDLFGLKLFTIETDCLGPPFKLFLLGEEANVEPPPIYMSCINLNKIDYNLK